MERPSATLHTAKRTSTSSLKAESATCTLRIQKISPPQPLNYTDKGEDRTENGNGNIEVAEAALLSTEQVCPSDLDRVEEMESPVKKRPKLDSEPSNVSPSVAMETDTTSSQQLPVRSQHLSHDISRILETPAPVIEPMDLTGSSNQETSSNTTHHKMDSDNPSGREIKPHRDESLALDQDGSRACEASKTIHASTCISETPFIRVSEKSNSIVTRIMETPFVSNTRVSSDGEDERSESVFTMETRCEMGDGRVPRTSVPDKSHIQIENDEELCILAKETQDIVDDHQSPDDRHCSSQDIDGGSCSVLGPTQVLNVPESQLNGPTVIVSDHLPLTVKTPPHKPESEHGTSSQSACSSSAGSQTRQSGETVCIGETQFAKTGSQDQKCSPANESLAMPSPPLSLARCEVQSDKVVPSIPPVELPSPIIPLQNSINSPRPGLARSRNKSSGGVSRVAETQVPASSSVHQIVPSSQPSPSPSKKQPVSLQLPGLMIECRQRPQAVAVHDQTSSTGKEDIDQNGYVAGSPTLTAEQRGVVKSPTPTLERRGVVKSPALTVEQNQNGNLTGPSALVGLTQSGRSRLEALSMSLAYSNLQSQQDSLQSQISCSVDLSSQQLEQLRLEMEAKQHEIDKLEAALRQVQTEETEPNTPVITQSPIESVTAIAETVPSNGSTASTEKGRSPEYSIEKSAPEPIADNQILALAGVTESSTHSQVQRDGSHEEKPTCASGADIADTVTNSHRSEQGESPKTSTEQVPELINEDSHLPHACANTSSTESSVPSQTQTEEFSEAPSSSQSVQALLQAADDVLRKLRNPPLAILEDRSSLEVDDDLCSGSTPSCTSIKAKLHISSATAKPTGANDEEHVPQAQRNNSMQATLEIDSGLCASTHKLKEDTIAKGSKISTGGAKKVHSSSSKSKKTKPPLVLLEMEDTLPPDNRNKIEAKRATKPSSNFCMGKECGSNLSSHRLPTVTQTPSRAIARGHGSRGSGRGSVPHYEAVVLQTPKIQCNSSRELPPVSPCRPLASVGKDHPPSYVESGLTKPQLVCYISIYPYRACTR